MTSSSSSSSSTASIEAPRFALAPYNATCVIDKASQTTFHLLSSEEAIALSDMLNYLAEMAKANEDYFHHLYILNPQTVARLKKLPDFS